METPTRRPGKVVCIGRNYREHAAELGNAVPTAPIFFLKPTTSVISDGQTIRLPPQSAEVHYEAELALIIGRRATCVPEASALDYVSGYAVLNDVTARDLQRADNRFTRAKGFDTFCPISHAELSTPPPTGARIQCYVDGVRKQDASLTDMVFPPAFLLAYVSEHMTLEPGDIIATGTPSGVGPLRAGQHVEVRLVDATGTVLLSIVNPVDHRRLTTAG